MHCPIAIANGLMNMVKAKMVSIIGRFMISSFRITSLRPIAVRARVLMPPINEKQYMIQTNCIKGIAGAHFAEYSIIIILSEITAKPNKEGITR